MLRTVNASQENCKVNQTRCSSLLQFQVKNTSNFFKLINGMRKIPLVRQPTELAIYKT